MKRKIIGLFIVLIIFGDLTSVSASSFPGKAPENSSHPFSSEFEMIINALPGFLDIACDVLAIMFLFASLSLGLSLAFKNPQLTKVSRNIMIGTLFSVLTIRILPIYMLTNDVTQFKLIVKNIVILLQSIGVHVAIGMVLIGLLIRFFYKMHENPAHHKWSRNLFIAGAAVSILSLVMPTVFNVL